MKEGGSKNYADAGVVGGNERRASEDIPLLHQGSG